ncbi:group-specific protein [Alkalicoccus daliensis]|uniref:Group-specific protein n=1 Tax=Alkalicoccus daliensis TaxID=745820 RepID=A0A1H0E215_9BACI|nr:group-specific protein [Alkalicoccus daliensis]SDN76333.1 hypothetical protein SAMN04488053_103173 [Alkalicoccus daliensis]
MACNLDHSAEDTQKKLEAQKSFLPEDLFEKSELFLKGTPSQVELNELFHLLKKYDLASEEEKKVRNQQMRELL